MTSMSKDTAMTASEEDRTQATEIVMCVMDAVRCSGGCEVSSLDRATVYAIEKKIATIRARAAAEATERAAKIAEADDRIAELEKEVERWRALLIATEHDSERRYDWWTAERDRRKAAEQRVEKLTEDAGHALNEYADSATNAIQWLRNVRDGLATPEDALKAVERETAENIERGRAALSVTTPAADALSNSEGGNE